MNDLELVDILTRQKLKWTDKSGNELKRDCMKEDEDVLKEHRNLIELLCEHDDDLCEVNFFVATNICFNVNVVFSFYFLSHLGTSAQPYSESNHNSLKSNNCLPRPEGVQKPRKLFFSSDSGKSLKLFFATRTASQKREKSNQKIFCI